MQRESRINLSDFTTTSLNYRIYLKKGKALLAGVVITTAFWNDLKVLGDLFSKLHDVQKVADYINGLEYNFALKEIN